MSRKKKQTMDWDDDPVGQELMPEVPAYKKKRDGDE